MTKKSTALDPSNQSTNEMEITQTEESVLPQNLEVRNHNVEQAYFNIIKECRELLAVFDGLRYRTSVTVDHRLSGKDTNLQNEWICYFSNVTLTKNKFGYYMIFFTYEIDAIKKFGEKQSNKFLRILFKCTDIVNTDVNIEHCIRIQEPTDLQPFFINRLLGDPKDYILIITEEKATS